MNQFEVIDLYIVLYNITHILDYNLFIILLFFFIIEKLMLTKLLQTTLDYSRSRLY